MHDRLDFLPLEDVDDAGGVGEVSDVEGGLGVDRSAVAVGEVVDDGDGVAAGDEQLDGVGTDVAGAADDANVHEELP